MEIKEEENKELTLSICKSDNDPPLDKKNDKLPFPLPDKNFIWALIGKPRSGKTTYLISLLSKRKSKGMRQSYRGLFENVIFVSPSLQSLAGNKDIERLKYKFDNITLDVLDEICEICQKNRDDDKKTCIVFDDVSSQFKSNKLIIDKLSHMCKNHRHCFSSIFILSQKYTDLPTGMRTCVNYLTMFNTDNLMERDKIFSELPIRKENYDPLYEHIFQNKEDANDRHNSMLLDMSRTRFNRTRVFKNFNLLDF